jgi:large subunit ribosomal protein L19
MDWLKLIHGSEATARSPSFDTGDEIRVWYKILEQGKERLGQFQGVVIRFRGSGPSKTFTVRRVTFGEGVERVFPLDAKVISKIELLRQGKVKRSRLYYLRSVIGKTRIAGSELATADTGADKPAEGERVAEKIGSPVPAAGGPAERITPGA